MLDHPIGSIDTVTVHGVLPVSVAVTAQILPAVCEDAIGRAVPEWRDDNGVSSTFWRLHPSAVRDQQEMLLSLLRLRLIQAGQSVSSQDCVLGDSLVR